jgi:hypothetical protein
LKIINEKKYDKVQFVLSFLPCADDVVRISRIRLDHTGHIALRTDVQDVEYCVVQVRDNVPRSNWSWLTLSRFIIRCNAVTQSGYVALTPHGCLLRRRDAEAHRDVRRPTDGFNSMTRRK